MRFKFEEHEKRHTLRMVKSSSRKIELLSCSLLNLKNPFLFNSYYLK